MKKLFRAKILKQLATEDPLRFKQAGALVIPTLSLNDCPRVPVAAFKGLPTEIDTSPIITHFKQVLLPEPDPEIYAKHILEAGVKWVFVPGLAFSPDGHRLGRGKGYYDRCLAVLRASANCPKIIGLCLKEQVISEIPIESHDQKVDTVLCL